MKTLIKYLLFAMLFVVSSCGERVVGLGDDELVTISEESLNCDVTGGHVSIVNFSEKEKLVLVGTTIEVVAAPDKGYEFIGWFVGNSEEPVSTNATFKFAASKNVTIVAKFEKTFMVSVQSAGNGSVAIKDIQDKTLELLIGSEITVTATPDANYDFLGWFIGDAETPVSTEATYTFTVNEGVALVAKFNKWPLVSISSGGNGAVSFENSSELSQYVQPGSELTVVATPDANYDFLGWFIGDAETPVSTEATYTFTVNEGVALVAKFNKWPLVSISSGGNGTVSFENSAELSQYVQPGSELTVVATPDADCDFLGWFVGNSEEPVSTDATYTFTVEENVTLIAKFKTPPGEAIDLGLSVKWANYNVGATAPEDYGGYYAWGETEEKTDYSWETYEWCNGSYDTMTKYCTDSSDGTVDNKTVLDPEDDVAHVKWGGSWRMPTIEEQLELRYECSWQWTTLNGVNGYRVTGPNGNSIFLPAAGYRSGTSLRNEESSGYYWSSTLDGSDGNHSNYANSSYFSDNHAWAWAPLIRYYGQSVRPVCK